MTLPSTRQVVIVNDDIEQPNMYVGTYEIPQSMILADQRKLYDAYLSSQWQANRAWQDLRKGQPWVPCPIPYLDFVQWLKLQHHTIKEVDIEIYNMGY